MEIHEAHRFLASTETSECTLHRLRVRSFSIFLCAAVAACEPTGDAQSISDQVSFTLACRGAEQASTNRGPVVVSPKVTGTFLSWDAKLRELYTGQPIDDVPFCEGKAQEECQVSITPDRLVARQFDMFPLKAPHSVGSYEEEIEVKFATMTGSLFVRNTSGTLRGNSARIDHRVEVRKPLTCELRPFTPPGSGELR